MNTASPMPHPLRSLWQRYARVAGAAWALRHELAGPARLADERAFLPAALSLQETPVHPAPRRTALAICAVFTAALAWACIGQLDVVAVAPGRLVVSDRSKLIQPLEAGVVKAIHVKDGDVVQPGQLLLELDATQARADAASVREQAATARSEAARAQALLQALNSGRAPAPLPQASAQEAHLLQAEWADMAGRQARHQAEVARRQAELATVREGVAKLSSLLPLAKSREADFKALGEQGMAPAHQVQDKTRERLELERDLATQQARTQEAQAALEEARKAQAAAFTESQRALSQRAAKAAQDLGQLAQQGAKSAQREQLTRLLAPVAGTVQQLAVHTPGGVVTPAQALMTLVPSGGGITADVWVSNQDIGFVREGMPAEVKLETFNFTRYGTLPAKVLLVSADAVVDEKRGAVFLATLELQAQTMAVDGKTIRLSPGLNVAGEIKIGRRRVIEYLLSPVRRVARESFGER